MSLSFADRMIQEYAPALKPKWTKYIPHVPTERQWAFLLLDCDEALYGGAAGGGKSDALLMAALQYVDVPGYAALLLRRTYADLEKPGSLIPRSHQWLNNTDAAWNGGKRQWTFPSGAVIDFGYLDNDADMYKYQSAEYQFIGFDELTQFEEQWYRYLFSRKRRLQTMRVPTRVRAATNPGGVGHDWVRQRFIIEGRQNRRVFVPARLDDNPHLDQEDYDKSLQALDTVKHQQLRYGDWSIRVPGHFFRKEWFSIIPTAPAGPAIRMWDLAATKQQTSCFTAGAKLQWQGGKLTVSHMRRLQGDPGEVESTIRQQAEIDGRNIAIWIEQEPGSGGVNTLYRYQHYVLAGWNVRAYLPKHDKLTRAGPLSGLARARGIQLVAGDWINNFLDEFEVFPEGKKDQVDTCSAGLQVLTQVPEPKLRVL